MHSLQSASRAMEAAEEGAEVDGGAEARVEGGGEEERRDALPLLGLVVRRVAVAVEGGREGAGGGFRVAGLWCGVTGVRRPTATEDCDRVVCS